MFLTILHISCCYPVFLFFPSLYSLPLLCIDLKFTFPAAALSLCSPLFVFHGIALLCLPLLFWIPSDVFPCHSLSLPPPPPTLFSHVPVFQCFCFSVPAFRSSCFWVFLFLCSCFPGPCFSVPVFTYSCFPVFLFFCSCFQIFLFSDVPVFRCSCFPVPCFSVPVFRCSCFPVSLFLFSNALFLCFCFQMFLFPDVSVFQCLVSLFLFSDAPVFQFSCFFVSVLKCSVGDVLVFQCSCFSVPVFRCSCFPSFLFSSVPFSSVPVSQCSCFFVPAVWTLRPVGLGCVDGTKTVASWSFLWEKTGYSLVHSDIQVCTYHTRQNWNARDTKVSSIKTVKEIGLGCSRFCSLLSIRLFFFLD